MKSNITPANKKNSVTQLHDEVDVRKKKFWKFWVVLFMVMLGMLVVVGRLLYIQIINSSKYTEQAVKQQQSKQEITPQRGNIYDRNGNLLASTIKSISIAVDPTELKNKEKLAILIEKHIGINKETILNKINSAKGQFVRLCRRVMPDKIEEIRKLGDKGILLIDEPIRYYNYSSVAAQVVGTASHDNKGLSGIELEYDSILSGRSGYMIMYRDAKQRLRPALNLPTIEPLNGSNICLTLDIELQKIAEFELMQGVISSMANSGTVIALDPTTGEVLACASYPGYNPNLPATYTSENMRIRTIADAYEPGSTFKAITAAAGLEENIVKPADLFNGYNGALVFASNQLPIKDEHPLDVTSFAKAFEFSSNIILSQVALKIPDSRYYKYIRDFGFGLKTGIDLPGEISGRSPKFDAMNSIDKRYLGFGYGIMVSPLQLTTAYSAIANNGKLMKPYIVSRIEKDKHILKEVKPQFVRNVMSEVNSKTLNDLLVGVVQRGTGNKAFIQDLKIAGKTGTAQLLESGAYSNSNHLASFIGYYPADHPKICMLICVDRPKINFYGGSVAAPIFKNITLRWASISPSILHSNNFISIDKDKRSNKNVVFVPDLTGLSFDDAEIILKEIGLSTKTDKKEGIVSSQFPLPGIRISRKSQVILNLDAPMIARTVGEIKDSQTASKLPNVKGLSIRRAISILQNSGFKANIRGSGRVQEQQWIHNDKKEYICILKCK